MHLFTGAGEELLNSVSLSLWLQSEYTKLEIVLSTVELYAFQGVGNDSSFLFLEFSSGDLGDLRLKVLLNSSGLGPPWDPFQA